MERTVDEKKARLTVCKERYNPVVLQQAVHRAANTMPAAHQAKLRGMA